MPECWSFVLGGVAKKNWGSGGDTKFLGSKKVVGDRGGKKLCGQKTANFLGIVKKCVKRAGGWQNFGGRGHQHPSVLNSDFN